MSQYLARRLATIVPTLLFVTMLIFGLQQLLPGDPAVVLAGEDRDPNVVAYLHEKLHLDDPLPLRYAYWLGGVLHGALGECCACKSRCWHSSRRSCRSRWSSRPSPW